MSRTDSLFFTSLFLSRLADQIVLFIVPLVIFQLTNSATLSGLAFFIETLPRFLAFPIAGVLCDLIQPYRIISVSQKIRAMILPLCLLGYYFIDSIYWLMGAAALVGAATSFGLMAREMILVQAFQKARFEKVISYASLADQLGMVLGPILAGVLLTLLSWQQSMTLCIFLFLLADVSLGYWWRVGRLSLSAQVKALPNHLKRWHPIPWLCYMADQLRLALAQIMSLPRLLMIALFAFLVNFLLGLTLATMAPIYTGVFGQSESSYALLQSLAVAVSILILLGITRFPLPVYWMGGIAFMAICLGALMTALSQHYGVYLVGFALIIGFDKMFSVFIRSLRKTLIPAENLGKSSGLLVLLNNIAQPLAGLMVALLASQYLLQDVLLVSTLAVSICALCVILFAYSALKNTDSSCD